MWTTLVLAAVLQTAPAQAGKLELTNVRPTFDTFGAPRPNNQVVPGDTFWLAFDVDNITVDKNNKATYSVRQEVQDSKGKVIFAEDTKDRPLTADLSVGGNRVPVSLKTDAGLDTAPGEYTLKVSVTDHLAKTTAAAERKFQVLAPTFGLVRLRTSYDPAGNVPAPMVGVPGQFVHINFAAVGFARDAKKQPNLVVEMNIVDEKGKPVLLKPDSGTINEKNGIPESTRGVPMGFVLALNRPGKFTVELKATDQVSKKTSTLKFPLTVLAIDK